MTNEDFLRIHKIDLLIDYASIISQPFWCKAKETSIEEFRAELLRLKIKTLSEINSAFALANDTQRKEISRVLAGVQIKVCELLNIPGLSKIVIEEGKIPTYEAVDNKLDSKHHKTLERINNNEFDKEVCHKVITIAEKSLSHELGYSHELLQTLSKELGVSESEVPPLITYLGHQLQAEWWNLQLGFIEALNTVMTQCDTESVILLRFEGFTRNLRNESIALKLLDLLRHTTPPVLDLTYSLQLSKGYKGTIAAWILAINHNELFMNHLTTKEMQKLCEDLFEVKIDPSMFSPSKTNHIAHSYQSFMSSIESKFCKF